MCVGWMNNQEYIELKVTVLGIMWEAMGSQISKKKKKVPKPENLPTIHDLFCKWFIALFLEGY